MKPAPYLAATLFLVLPAHCKAAEPRAVFKLEPYRKTVALRARVNGRPGLFVFDTGGGISILSPRFAEQGGCKSWGRLSGFRMMGDRLDMPQGNDVTITLGDHDFKAPVVGIYDIGSLFPKDATPIDGLIALDLFAGKSITIDFPKKLLIVESPGSLRSRTRKAVELPVRLARELQGRALAASVGVRTPQGLVWMELDSGNGGTILVSKPYASLFGLDPTKEGPQSVEFTLGEGLPVRGPAFTPDMILDGNLGMPFLKDVALTLDLSAGRLWVSRSE